MVDGGDVPQRQRDDRQAGDGRRRGRGQEILGLGVDVDAHRGEQ